MYRAGRSKRASAEELYKTCKTGDCPPDVKNKIEGDTWADRLLKWFGSFVYFGGLGIGTGRGSGGSTGYRPFGGVTTRPVPETIPIRPAVPIEPLGPAEVIPIDAAGPSVIELSELQIPDPSVIDVANPTTNLGPGEIDIVSAVDPITDLGNVGGHPTVISTPSEEAAVLEVSPIPPPKRFALDVTGQNPNDHIVVYSSTTHPDPDINIFVDSRFSGEIVGDVEEIPLQDLNRIEEFEIEEVGPQSSTPMQIFENVTGRAKSLYNRFTEQVPTRNPYFLGPTSRAVQFEFENPAYEADVTYTFERDVAELTAAPDSDFRDLQILHRPQYSITSEGLLRVSRLGQRATMTTRSGLQIGQAVHFYQDISAIEPADTIEMQTLSSTSHVSTTVNSMSQGTFINPLFNDNIYEEDELIDEIVEDFNNAHLVLTHANEEEDTILTPTIPPGTSIRVFIDDYGSGINIYYPNPLDLPAAITPATHIPDGPVLIIDPLSDNYNLHPSLIRRKRKRSDLF